MTITPRSFTRYQLHILEVVVLLLEGVTKNSRHYRKMVTVPWDEWDERVEVSPAGALVLISWWLHVEEKNRIQKRIQARVPGDHYFWLWLRMWCLEPQGLKLWFSRQGSPTEAKIPRHSRMFHWLPKWVKSRFGNLKKVEAGPPQLGSHGHGHGSYDDEQNSSYCERKVEIHKGPLRLWILLPEYAMPVLQLNLQPNLHWQAPMFHSTVLSVFQAENFWKYTFMIQLINRYLSTGDNDLLMDLWAITYWLQMGGVKDGHSSP